MKQSLGFKIHDGSCVGSLGHTSRLLPIKCSLVEALREISLQDKHMFTMVSSF